MIRAAMLAGLLSQVGCEPPPIEGVASYTLKRGDAVLTDTSTLDSAFLTGCGTDQWLETFSTRDDFRVVFRLQDDDAVPLYVAFPGGRFADGDGISTFDVEDGSGTVRRGPLEADWQTLETIGEGTLEYGAGSLSVSVAGRFYRIAEYGLTGVTACPG